MCVCVCVPTCACVHCCKQLPSNQSFDKQISSYQKGVGVSRWGEWVGKATAYKFDTCTVPNCTTFLTIKFGVEMFNSCTLIINYSQKLEFRR